MGHRADIDPMARGARDGDVREGEVGQPGGTIARAAVGGGKSTTRGGRWVRGRKRGLVGRCGVPGTSQRDMVTGCGVYPRGWC